MSIPKHSASSIAADGRYTQHIGSVTREAACAPDLAELSASWRRSAVDYSVDPIRNEPPRILTSHEIKDFREPVDELVFSAQEEIDRLYKIAREAGYTILLSQASGVVVENRAADSDASRFRYWGTWLGGVWSEKIEGTNGIGTCIAEERPVTVHRRQHFRSRHKDLSCSGAPIFDTDGRLMAVLDVSAVDPDLSERAHALTGALTATAARAIEERFFRERFRKAWIVAAARSGEDAQGLLLAVDGDERLVGADRVARRSLSLGDHALRAGVDLWSLFERDAELFRRKDRADIPTRLTSTETNETWSVLVTPPEHRFSAFPTPLNAVAHTRPRLDLIDTVGRFPAGPRTRGGLSPRAVKRVRDHVTAHLSERIDLATLASVAGVSVYHFAREFKHSTGVTPHAYLVARRVERAQDMLARTDLSLSEVACAVGFSDQSHLARHFRQVLGTTPGKFRRSQR